MNNFYVYILKNPITEIPFYVGKGTGRRAYRHEADVRLHDHHWNSMVLAEIRRILAASLKVIVEFVQCDMDHDQAKLTERLIIAKIGRRNKKAGPLCNLTDGGEGSFGRVFKHSEETKEKIKLSCIGKKNSDESNIKRSMAMSGKHIGRVLSKEWIDKIAEANRGKKMSEEFRQNLKNIRLGENNPAARTFNIECYNGESTLIKTHKNLKQWCKDNKVFITWILNGKEHNGWKLKKVKGL